MPSLGGHYRVSTTCGSGWFTVLINHYPQSADPVIGAADAIYLAHVARRGYCPQQHRAVVDGDILPRPHPASPVPAGDKFSSPGWSEAKPWEKTPTRPSL